MQKNSLFEKLIIRDRVKKWRNISIILFLVALFFGMKLFGDDGKISKDYIARVHIDGVIKNDNYRDDKLEKIIKDKSIKAVIFHVESPGGAIVSSEQIFDKMRRIAAKKPIVVVMGNVAASGGYMVSLASDYIIAGNGTITGSIGVILQTFEALDLLDKVGVKPLIYKSSELKANPSMFEKPTEKAEKVLNDSIKDSHQFFMELVAERRNMNMFEVEKVADGRIFTGRQALEAGLVDAIGYESDALKYLQSQKGINTGQYEVKDYEITEIIDGLGIGKLFGSMLHLKNNISSQSEAGIMAIYKEN